MNAVKLLQKMNKFSAGIFVFSLVFLIVFKLALLVFLMPKRMSPSAAACRGKP